MFEKTSDLPSHSVVRQAARPRMAARFPTILKALPVRGRARY